MKVIIAAIIVALSICAHGAVTYITAPPKTPSVWLNSETPLDVKIVKDDGDPFTP